MYALTLQNELFAWTPLSTLFPSGAEPVHTFTLILHHVLCFAATQTVYLVEHFMLEFLAGLLSVILLVIPHRTNIISLGDN